MLIKKLPQIPALNEILDLVLENSASRSIMTVRLVELAVLRLVLGAFVFWTQGIRPPKDFLFLIRCRIWSGGVLSGV